VVNTQVTVAFFPKGFAAFKVIATVNANQRGLCLRVTPGGELRKLITRIVGVIMGRLLMANFIGKMVGVPFAYIQQALQQRGIGADQ